MPRFDFDAARRSRQATEFRDPVVFVYGGEEFIALPDPTLGDTFDLYDAPDMVGPFDSSDATHLEIVRTLARFIERMLPPEDRARFQQAHYRIPSTEAGVVVEVAEMLVREVVAARPTGPPASSSSGRQYTGPSSRS